MPDADFETVMTPARRKPMMLRLTSDGKEWEVTGVLVVSDHCDESAGGVYT